MFLGCSRETVKVSSALFKDAAVNSKYDYLIAEAIRQKYVGKADQAVALFEKCIEIDKNRSVPYFELAQAYAKMGDSDKAIRYASRAANLDRNNYWYQMACGSLFVQYEEKDSALVYFQRALYASPKAMEVNTILAGLYSEKGDISKADSLFMILDRAGALNEQMFLVMISGMISNKAYTAAAERTRALINRFPEEVKYKALLANIYSEAGEGEKSDSIYSRIIEDDPNNAESQMLVLINLVSKKKYEGVSVFLGSVIKSQVIDRERKVALVSELNRDSAYIVSQNKTLEASLLLLEEDYPDDEEVLSIRPEMYEKLGMTGKAIGRYEEILSKVPKGYFFKERLILLYAGSEEYEKLYNLASAYSSENNRSIIGKVYYAIAAMELGKYDVADSELNKALILAGNDKQLKLQVLSMLGELKYRMKDFEEAYKYMEKALIIDPDNIMLLNNYSYFLAENDRELQKALKMTEKVIAKDSNNATYLDTYAWVLYKSGKIKEAYGVMRKIFEKSEENDPEILEHMGFILKTMSKCNEAVNYWRMALEGDSSKEYLKKEIELCGGEKQE